MKTTTLETVVQPERELKTKDVISRMIVTSPPISAELVTKVAPPTTTVAIAPTKKEAKPRLATRSSIGLNWRSAAIAASITAVPIALRFLVRPKSKRGKAMLAAVSSIASSLPWNYLFNIRPNLLYWGATVAEVKQALPGDELVPSPQMNVTYAITINAPAAAVWPWLAQMGQGRGGLYSYEWLENLVGLQIHNADTIIPELQNLKAGDKVRLAPGDAMALEVAVLEPERTLVLCYPNLLLDGKGKAGNYFKREMNVTWTFALVPISEQASRLIVRWRIDWQPTLATTLAVRLLQEPAQFIMERKMMLGIKQRVERTR